MTTTTDLSTRKHAAVPLEGTFRLDASAHTVAECRWCGKVIQQTHPHSGGNPVWRHPLILTTRKAAKA